MGQTLEQIAEKLRGTDKKVQLIYAFNGTGKTRLSGEFKELIAPKNEDGNAREKLLYYNAFTEDLFIWDNDLAGDVNRILKIQSNSFTKWILKDQGQDQNIVSNFQHYAGKKLTPRFDATFSEVTFTLDHGDDQSRENCKISKGEESLFIWSVFYALLDQVVDAVSVPELAERETNQFDDLEYVFIDDPVSSLDENHLIELAQNLATLIKSSPLGGPKFIVTTHNPLFYNVLFNALKNGLKYRLTNNEDGSFDLEPQRSDSPFAYHLHLIEKLKLAAKSSGFEKYHYNFLRNILEKTSTFMGYDDWADLLPKTADGTSDAYLKRIVDISSHSKHSGYELSELSQDDKRVLRFLLIATANKQYEFPKRYQVDSKEGASSD